MKTAARARIADEFPRLSRIAGWLVERADRVIRAVAPGERAWNGAAVGLLIAAAVVVGQVFLHGALLPAPSSGRVVAVALRLGEALAVGVGLAVLVVLLARTSARFRFAFPVSVVIFTALIGSRATGLQTTLFVIAASALTGAGIAVTAGGGMRDTTRVQRAVALLGLAVGVAAVVVAGVWVADEGDDPLEVRNAAAEVDHTIEPLAADDPSATGDWPVLTLTYGSGEDRRPEYGDGATLITESVDGSPFIDGWSGRSGRARTAYWGFDEESLPLQGRVWYPEGEGPFPLVLVVHGNHSMEDYSDPGYEYLGELLASRGMILVSVDENFINGSAVGGLRRENDARGWLLLEHLRQWGEWNAADDNLFAGKVDMSRLGLIGHSRGGEAVAVAAAFNRLARYPDDATVELGYGFDIGAVIAIAPVYGQYRPGGRLTQLRDVNYMSIHGANDGDVTSFMGSAQYENVTFSGDDYRFKATAYVYGANHGQFNTTWGDTDWGMPFARYLNRRALMPDAEQRQTARVFISAFLEAALRGRTEYLELFRDYRRAGDWLPETVYVTDFDDSTSRRLITFDEDIDVTTGTTPGASTHGDNLTVWREDLLRLKFGTKETAAVYLGWDRSDGWADDTSTDDPPTEDDDPPTEGDATPRYTIDLGADYDVSGDQELFFVLADADEDPSRDEEPADDEDSDDDDTDDHRQEGDEDQQAAAHGDEGQQHQQDDEAGTGEAETDEEDDDEPREPIDLTVRLVDADGDGAALPLSRFSFLQPQLEVQIQKGRFGNADRAAEPIPQRFAFPLTSFTEANAELDLDRLRAIELLFDRTEAAVVILDNVGFR